MSKRGGVLLVGQTPPPYHGQSVMTGMLFDHDWEDMPVHRLRMAYSDGMESVGKASLGKVFHLIALVFSTWKIFLIERPKVLYYLPASPNRVPVLRDILYLLSVRWLFSKTVYHYHAGGLGEYLQSQSLLRKLARVGYGCPDVAIDVNILTPHSGRFFRAKRELVVMNGVDFQGDLRQDRNDAEVRVLSVGLLCEEKGTGMLLNVARHFKNQNVKFIFVGEWVSAEYAAEMNGRAAEYGIADRVEFSGPMSGQKKWDSYASADIFAFPSVHPTETFGIVLLEAMATGLPVLTVRWRGTPHVVEEDVTAVLCEPNDELSMVAGLKRLVENQELREEFGKRGRERYLSKFTKKNYLDGMRRVFQGVIEE